MLSRAHTLCAGVAGCGEQVLVPAVRAAPQPDLPPAHRVALLHRRWRGRGVGHVVVPQHVSAPGHRLGALAACGVGRVIVPQHVGAPGHRLGALAACGSQCKGAGVCHVMPELAQAESF